MRYIIFLAVLFCAQFGFSQVGIGTEAPTPGYSLDVNGSLLVQKEFKHKTFPLENIQNLESQFLVRVENSVPPGEVKRLDLSQIPVGPINIADYVFENILGDNLVDVDLQFDSSKYIVGLGNFRYTGAPILKGSTNYGNIGNFVTRTFVSGGTWHIEIRNRAHDAPISAGIKYYVTLIVYDRKYFKELAPIDVNMGGGNTGSTPIPTELQ